MQDRCGLCHNLPLPVLCGRVWPAQAGQELLLLPPLRHLARQHQQPDQHSAGSPGHRHRLPSAGLHGRGGVPGTGVPRHGQTDQLQGVPHHHGQDTTNATDRPRHGPLLLLLLSDVPGSDGAVHAALIPPSLPLQRSRQSGKWKEILLSELHWQLDKKVLMCQQLFIFFSRLRFRYCRNLVPNLC